MSDTVKEIVDIPGNFFRDGTNFLNRCTKPNRKEYIQICRAVGMGFVVMGFIGYFVKLVSCESSRRERHAGVYHSFAVGAEVEALSAQYGTMRLCARREATTFWVQEPERPARRCRFSFASSLSWRRCTASHPSCDEVLSLLTGLPRTLYTDHIARCAHQRLAYGPV